MKTLPALALALVLLPGPLLANDEKSQSGLRDPRIQTIRYDPDHVAVLRGTLGYQFMLEFDPSEKIQTVSIGDSLAWQVTPNRGANVLFLKPMSRSSTNLTVLTDLRRYAFELAVAPKSAAEPVLYIARISYPPPAVAIPIGAPPRDVPPSVVNSAYRMTGSTSERPLHIFDDGHMTYFEWAPDAGLPAIFALSAEGQESLVNFMVRNPYVVVDQVSPGFVLRDGKEVVKVVNEGIGPVARGLR
jgi:type IV secretion system protein VirB9